jgi:translation initiation factor 1 (eIF-1/SUI1)
MDDFIKKPTSGVKTEPAIEDKKIEFRLIKEKKFKTYMFNLELYVKDPVQLETILRNLKKSLGTSCAAKDTETEFGRGYGFGGDFSRKIKKYLIDNGHVTKEAFK